MSELINDNYWLLPIAYLLFFPYLTMVVGVYFIIKEICLEAKRKKGE